jgi:hypothetical protein
LLLVLLLFPPPFDDGVGGGRDGPKEILTSVPPLPVVRFSTEDIRFVVLLLPELLFVLVVMFTVLFSPVGLVVFAVRPPELLLVISTADDELLLAESLLLLPLRFTVLAHTFRFLPLFVVAVVEPAEFLPAILLLGILFVAETDTGYFCESNKECTFD